MRHLRAGIDADGKGPATKEEIETESERGNDQCSGHNLEELEWLAFVRRQKTVG